MSYFRTGAFLLFFLLAEQVSFAQSLPQEQSVTSKLKLNFFLPGVSYEQKISQLQTLHFSAFIDLLFTDSDFNGSTETYAIPSIGIEFRNYYNLDKRNLKGKHTEGNSGNYFAPVYTGKYSFYGFNDQDTWVSQLGFVWGLQRNYNSTFSLDFNIGLGYNINIQNSYLYYPIDLIANLSLGFWLGKKNAVLKAEFKNWSKE